MDSVAAIRWSDLPPELLSLISCNLQNGADLVIFRSVCQSWRFSTSPPPNKLSPFFPLALPCSTFQSDLKIKANAIYLLRRRRDPLKPWLVSVQESVAGNLVLRHALTNEKIPGRFPPPLDDWIVTQIATICTSCDDSCSFDRRRTKAAFVTNFSDDDGSLQLAGACHREDSSKSLCFFELGFNGEPREIKLNFNTDFFRNCDVLSDLLTDFVRFKGRIYAIDKRGILFLVDFEKSRLIPVTCEIRHPEVALEPRHWTAKVTCSARRRLVRLVVSDGDLYAVLSRNLDSEFTVNRLLITRVNGMMIEHGEWEEVEDLGERVFFLTPNCSFSVSAQDLPRPCKGNCIVYVHDQFCCKNTYCKKLGINVFFVGGEHPRLRPAMSSLKGYVDLFDPPYEF